MFQHKSDWTKFESRRSEIWIIPHRQEDEPDIWELVL
jgi:hypothetical protein